MNLLLETFEFKDDEVTNFTDLLKIATNLKVIKKIQEYWFQFDCNFDENGRCETFAQFFISGAMAEIAYEIHKRASKEYHLIHGGSDVEEEIMEDSLNDTYINDKENCNMWWHLGDQNVIEILKDEEKIDPWIREKLGKIV